MLHVLTIHAALHLRAAARKGSAALLRSLVDAGGAAALLTADCEGKTAAEIARRNGNGAPRLAACPGMLLHA